MHIIKKSKSVKRLTMESAARAQAPAPRSSSRSQLPPPHPLFLLPASRSSNSGALLCPRLSVVRTTSWHPGPRSHAPPSPISPYGWDPCLRVGHGQSAWTVITATLAVESGSTPSLPGWLSCSNPRLPCARVCARLRAVGVVRGGIQDGNR